MATNRSDTAPGLGALRPLLLKVARQRSIEGLPPLIVDHLSERPGVALARIWLLGPGDLCTDCKMRPVCPEQSRCLHLVASAGRSRTDSNEVFDRLGGEFRRFPLGVGKVGRVGTAGEPLEIGDVADVAEGLDRPDWGRREGIRGVGVEPLIFGGEILGVLAVFTRSPVAPEGFARLRELAEHAAAAIAGAQEFDDGERRRARLELENAFLREEVDFLGGFGGVVGESPALDNVVRKIELVAASDSEVLVLGEPGTGKELVAREIRRRSQRRDGPLIRVDCASIPRDRFESELFGGSKREPAGMRGGRPGRIEMADGGTLFLNGVEETPLELQPRLLRVLEEGRLERVDEERTRPVDVRIIAASRRDLRAEVEAGRLREDLYYRLNVFVIEMPPLRERRKDIVPLARHFLDHAARELGLPRPRFGRAVLRRLERYDWPGNVRELRNVVERAVITSGAVRLEPALPERALEGTSRLAPGGDDTVLSEAEMRRIEERNLRTALGRCGWKIYGPGGAAALLGIRPTTLASRMKKMGIERPAVRP